MSVTNDLANDETLYSMVESAGYGTAAIILIFSIYLYIQGYRRMEAVGAASAGMIAYIFAPEAYNAFLDLDIFSMDPVMFQNSLALICAVLGFLIVRATVRSLAAIITFLAVYSLLQVAGQYGIDAESGTIIPGVVSIFAFFFIRGMRDVVPRVFSGLLGSYGFMVAIIIITNQSPEYIDFRTSFIPFLTIPLTYGSWRLQKRDERIREEKAEAKSSGFNDPMFNEQQTGSTYGDTNMPLFLDD